MLDIFNTVYEIVIFALVYGYARSGREYYGSLEHTARWVKCSPHTVFRTFAALVQRGYLDKREKAHGAAKRCYYTVNTDNVHAAIARLHEPKGGITVSAEATAPLAERQRAISREATAPLAESSSTVSTEFIDHEQRGNGTISTEAMYTTNDSTSTTPLTNTIGGDGETFTDSEIGKDEKPEPQDRCPFDETKPLGPDESRWSVKCWELCCKHWNRLGLKPECRIFFQIFPADRAAEVIKIFQAYSLKDIKSAIENYKNHMKADMEIYKPPLTFGSLATFLISGVPRYFDDGAIDQQFKIQKGAKNGRGL